MCLFACFCPITKSTPSFLPGEETHPNQIIYVHSVQAFCLLHLDPIRALGMQERAKPHYSMSHQSLQICSK